jgi:hypothetical protein
MILEPQMLPAADRVIVGTKVESLERRPWVGQQC